MVINKWPRRCANTPGPGQHLRGGVDVADDRSSARGDRAEQWALVRDELVAAIRDVRPRSARLVEFADALEAISDPVELEAVLGWVWSHHS